MIIHDDCQNAMRKMEANSIDFVVTDPPYGLHFMGKDWDGSIPAIEIWAEALRVCKPGAMLAAFGGSRTHHHLMLAIEGAGWEIRDVMMWIYGSGFPKSHNHFGLEGYGTALKPAYEPIILAMKPSDGTFKQNVEKWGIGGVNIDDNRIGSQGATKRSNQADYPKNEDGTEDSSENWARTGHNIEEINKGRWPTNIILDEEAAEMLDEMSGVSKSTNYKNHEQKQSGDIYEWSGCKTKYTRSGGHNDSGGASRFFYCAKASSKERNKGLEGMPLKDPIYSAKAKNGEGFRVSDSKIPKQNSHPTVKPISLMKYIITLLAPPNNPTLLDPFCGSGSTLVAAAELGINTIGIEKEAEYCEIARKRVAAVDQPLFKFGT